MSRRPPILSILSFKGLTAAPSQANGAIRLVPLLRERVRDDLRLALRSYSEDYTVVTLGGRHCEPGVRYSAYVPHALIVSWSSDGSPVAAFGGRLSSNEES